MFKKILKINFVLSLMFLMTALVFETTLLNAATATDDVIVTLVVESEITISDGSNITMAPNFSISNNSSIGTSQWTVVTSNATGYNLAVKASTNPALQSASNSFDDYTEDPAGTPDAWSVGAGDYEFGFSAFGDDVEAEYGTGSSCGSGGTPTATLNYEGLSTTDEQIATSNLATPVAGTTTTFCVAAGQNGVFAPSGTYTATVTATASTL